MKICGITNLQDALMACELGADALGFIIYEKSPRFIQPAAAKEIMQSLPPFITKVGVFVNMPINDLSTICESLPLNLVQLHGNESPEYCQQVTLPCLKAFQVEPNFNLLKLNNYHTNGFLLDTFVKDKYGGTGKTFDWNIAIEAKKFGRIVLSGGLNSENILEALNFVEPYAVDVSSGVEASPGNKHLEKMQVFFREVRKYSRISKSI